MKILFTDLDDTLLNNQSQVSPETKAFLDEFLADGNRLVLSSGRPLVSVMEVKELAGLTQPGIFLSASNGARVYDCDRKRTIRKIGLPLSCVSYMQEQAKELSLHIRAPDRYCWSRWCGSDPPPSLQFSCGTSPVSRSYVN